MKVALFLVGVLRDALQDEAKRSNALEKRWRKEFEEFESQLPEPEKRTIEQWEQYVDLAGELYYAIAAESSDSAHARHLNSLYDAIAEVE